MNGFYISIQYDSQLITVVAKLQIFLYCYIVRLSPTIRGNMERQTSNRLASTVGRRNPFFSLSLTTSGWRKIPPLAGVSVPTSAALPPSACSRYAITGEAANAEELALACETAADEAEPVVWRLRPSNSPRRGGTGSERGSRPPEARRKEPRNRRPRPPRADTGVARRGGGGPGRADLVGRRFADLAGGEGARAAATLVSVF
jgi:hypothetical protein